MTLREAVLKLETGTLVDVIGPAKVRFSQGGSRRQAGRVPVSLAGLLRAVGEKDWESAAEITITDVSTVGVGFLHGRAMVRGERFVLRVPRRGGGKPLAIVCAAHRCRAVDDGRFAIGGAFVKLLREDDEGRPPAAAVKRDGRDKRRAERVRRAALVQISLCRDGKVLPPTTVSMQDFATFGLGLLHAAPLERGEQFVIRLVPKAAPPVRLLYTVAHCRKTGDGRFAIGAEFTCLVPGDEQAMEACRR